MHTKLHIMTLHRAGTDSWVVPWQNVGWQIATGPLQLIFGALGGLLGACMCACTKVWDRAWKRAAIVFLTSTAP